MTRLRIPDRGRLIADVVPLGERPRPEVDLYGVIHAWRTEPDPDYDTSRGYSLRMYGEALDGSRTKVFSVPEGVIAQGIRERFAAIRIAALLLTGRTTT